MITQGEKLPLHVAARNGHLSIISVLLEKGAGIDSIEEVSGIDCYRGKAVFCNVMLKDGKILDVHPAVFSLITS
jgi:ankyrin repeat protein